MLKGLELDIRSHRRKETLTNDLSVESLQVVNMDKEKARTRRKIKEISSVKDFNDLLDQVMLSEEERKIMELHYKGQKSLAFIADMLGMSEITVKKKHSKILKKIGNLF